MKKTSKLRAACYLVMAGSMVGAMPMVYAASDNLATPMNQQQSAFNLPPGFTQTDLSSASGIKTGLVKLTERAVTKGDYNSFLAELSVPDRTRAREFKNADQKQLDAKIDQFQRAWQAKYGQKFDISDKNLVFNDQVQIIQGKVSDPSLALSNWPVPAAQGEAMTASDQSYGNTRDEKQQTDQAKLTKGRDVALVRFMGNDRMPPLTVSIIFNYPDFWRVDVPNNRTGEQIYNDLSRQIDDMTTHQDRWPNDVEEAYRIVARHAIAALYGVPADMENGRS
jgi:hypothetical protein